MIPIAVLFVVPVYYLAKSKGYSGKAFSVITACLYVLGLFLPKFVILPYVGLAPLIFPAFSLLLVALLKARKGAPGKSYLKITFSCPECGKTVSFPRHREGVAELCPECGELIRVPEDDHSPKSSACDRRKPAVAQGEVCFESFGRFEPANLLVAILNDNGIEAHVSGDDGGGMLPQIGNTQGYRVMLDVSQWDEAVKIERECQQSNSV